MGEATCQKLIEAASDLVMPRCAAVLAEQTEKQTFLSAYIAHRIKEIGYPVKSVSDAMGHTRQFVYAVMAGNCPIPETFLTSLADVTDITLAELAVARAMDTVHAQ